jgi:hypothetical protein
MLFTSALLVQFVHVFAAAKLSSLPIFHDLPLRKLIPIPYSASTFAASVKSMMNRPGRTLKPTKKYTAYKASLNLGPSGNATTSQNTTSAKTTKTTKTTQQPKSKSSKAPSKVSKSARTSGKTASASTTPLIQAKINECIANIYREIHLCATSQRGALKKYEITDFLYRARVSRFFDLLPSTDRAALEDQLRRTDARASRPVQDSKEVLDDTLLRHRVREFCNEQKLLLFCICAHSNTFQKAIDRIEIDNTSSITRNSTPDWSDVYRMVEHCASSLELFALCYDYDWVANLRAHEQHFDTMLSQIYDHDQREQAPLIDITAKNFGIRTGDLTPLHQIPENHEGRTHHHWALPTVANEPAVRVSVECEVTTDMKEKARLFTNDFERIMGRKRSRPAPPEEAVGERLRIIQMNIAKSQVLKGHEQSWPYRLQKFPVFCDSSNRRCAVCREKSSEQDPTKQVKAKDYACHCSFEDLLKDQNRPGFPYDKSRDILLELYDTGTVGNGVRALQSIPRDTYIGAYVGEVYPLVDKTGRDIIRYGEPADTAYQFRVPEDSQKPPDPVPYFAIDSAHLGNWTRFMNHSCDPVVEFSYRNIGQEWHVVCRTLKKVHFGQPLTASYGDEYFISRRMPCLCATEKCRLSQIPKRKASADDSDDHSDDQSPIPQRKKLKTIAQTNGKSTQAARKQKSAPPSKAAKKRGW